MTIGRLKIFDDISKERDSQDAKWGVQNWPIRNEAVTIRYAESMRECMQTLCDSAAKDGNVSFQHILEEEVSEVFAEIDPVKQRAELLHVAAVAVQMIEKIDRDNA